MTDYIKFFINKQIPLWLTLIICVPLFLVKLTPLFDLFYKIYKDKKDRQEKHFKEVEGRISDLQNKMTNLLQSTNKLKSNKTKSNIENLCQVSDNFFNDLEIICEGINRGFIMRNNVCKNVIYEVLKHKYDKEDNMIADCYNILYNMNRQYNIILPPLRITKYRQIFICYKQTLPLWRRIIGLFCNKVLIIK